MLALHGDASLQHKLTTWALLYHGKSITQLVLPSHTIINCGEMDSNRAFLADDAFLNRTFACLITFA